METLEGYWAQFLAYLPNLIGAIILIVVAFIVAAVARAVTVRVLRAARLDERLGRGQPGGADIVQPSGSIVYYVVLLLFLPGVLGLLGLNDLVDTATGFFASFLGFLPNIIGAILILVIGFFIARILRSLVTTVASTAGLDRVSDRLNLPPRAQLSNLLGLIVYALVVIPVIAAALDALQLEAVTLPVTAMLGEILAALPNIFAAIVIVAIAWYVGQIVGNIAAGIAQSLGFDRLAQSIGMRVGTATSRGAEGTGTDTTAGGAAQTTRAPSDYVGYFVQGAIVLFALISAFNALGAEALAALTVNFVQLAGQILLGLLIFAVGLWLANFLAGLVLGNATGASSRLLAGVARWSTVALFFAMALRQMGIANSIVNLAFGLTLGAIAVAFALAFGLGARDTAGKVAERWRENLEEGGATPPPTGYSPADD